MIAAYIAVRDLMEVHVITNQPVDGCEYAYRKTRHSLCHKRSTNAGHMLKGAAVKLSN